MELFKRKNNNIVSDSYELPLEQAGKITQSMMEQVGLPCHVYSAEIPLKELMDRYKQAVERGKREGFVPVLVPEDDILDEYFGILKDEDGYDVQDVLNAASTLDGESLLKERFKELTEPEDEDLEGLSLEEIMGEMENGEAINVFSALSNFGDGSLKETILFEVPTQNPWEIPAYVPFGGWNDCPAPEEMTAICKYWFGNHGAVPATITHDTLELILPEAVPEENAMEIAKEHYAFCNDRVDQCTESYTLGEVADSIRKSTIWFFWWD